MHCTRQINIDGTTRTNHILNIIYASTTMVPSWLVSEIMFPNCHIECLLYTKRISTAWSNQHMYQLIFVSQGWMHRIKLCHQRMRQNYTVHRSILGHPLNLPMF
jgi:hypothetical protein